MGNDETDAADEPSRPTARTPRDEVGSGRGRRAFLGLLAAAGVGAVTATWFSGRDVRPASREEVPIVYGIARADSDGRGSVEPLQKTVPADWLEELSYTLDVHRSLPVSDLTGFLGSFVVPGDASDPTASIAVQATSERLRDELADLSLDVDVAVEVFEELPDPTGRGEPLDPEVTADLDDRSVPGGVLCGNEETRGSLAPALHDPEAGDRFFATANHVYGGSGTDKRGEPLYVYTDDDRSAVGRVRRGFAEDDLLVADPVDGRVPASEISDASPGSVGGQFTELGVADLAARGESMEMTGAVSGRTSGEIKGIDGVTFYTGEGVRTGQILWGEETSFTDGDSGSVNYHVDPRDDDRVLVGGLNSARTWWPGADFTWGTAAYAIRERHGLVF